MKRILALFITVFFSIIVVDAQERVIHGVVNTLDSIPLIGVEIKVQSTKQTVFSDSLGKFTVACNKEDKLKIKANGFYTENININEKVKIVAINMRLKPGVKQQNYAIGYGYVSAEDKATPGSKMEIKQSDYTKYSNVYDILRVMGAQVVNGDIILRGNKSFQSSSAALIVVDGVITDYDYLSAMRPVDIKRIDILQDPASSVYGSRGSNGVVQIETIKGK